MLKSDDMNIFMFLVLPDFSRTGFLEPSFSAILISGNLNCQASITKSLSLQYNYGRRKEKKIIKCESFTQAH